MKEEEKEGAEGEKKLLFASIKNFVFIACKLTC